MDVFDKINNNTIVGGFKQISETRNREVSLAGIPADRHSPTVYVLL